jgi:hypothetical protein
LSGPELGSIEEVRYLGHRFEVEGRVNDAVDRAFGEVFGWLADVGVRPAEAPFILVPARRSSPPPGRGSRAGRPSVSRRPTDRGSAIGCYLERYLIGPNEEPDHSRWQTELAYLVTWP